MGIDLNLADDDAGMQFLEEVEKRFQRDDKRLLEVIKKWLRSPHLQQTWRRLLETLNNLELTEAVKKIEEQILGTETLLANLRPGQCMCVAFMLFHMIGFLCRTCE